MRSSARPRNEVVMTIETIPFDVATYLDTPERQAVFLRDALETGDAEYIDHALGVIIRARAMAEGQESHETVRRP